MTPENLAAIRTMQATLLKIKNQEDVFFNVAQYEKLGLVKPRSVATHKKSAYTGEPLRKTEWLLTEKAHQFLSVML
jgi:hypothetical protein